MHYFHWIAGTILALIWLSRVVDAAIGMPSVANISTPDWDRTPVTASGTPRVSIIVAARNEEADIRETLKRLLALDYSNYEIVAVNDRSSDRTGLLMDETAATPQAQAHLTVIHVKELPAGWLGKTHAMWRASCQATGDWLLFTDADVLFKPDALRRALAYAESVPADHVVVLPRMIMLHPGERMMMAFFQTLVTFGHRAWKVADPRARDYIGVGAFNLVRRSAYDAVGTHQALRMEIVDDMKLGKVIKNAGFAQRCVFADDMISLRWAEGARGIVENLTKNFFALLSYQWWRTVASVFAVAFLNLGPFLGVLLAHGWQRAPYAVALFSIFLIYWGMASRSAVRPYYFVLHPVSSCLLIYILLRSMAHTLRHDGIIWRGTRYPLEELRKGLV
jgi:cellulose synthase/poly-beta-1,6-N-acetylglucosamine synthase-like glycosyltransferase